MVSELKTEAKTPHRHVNAPKLELLVQISIPCLPLPLPLPLPSPSVSFPLTPLLAWHKSDSSPGFLAALYCPLQAPSVSTRSPEHSRGRYYFWFLALCAPFSGYLCSVSPHGENRGVSIISWLKLLCGISIEVSGPCCDA